MPFPYNITSIRLSLASGLSISPAGLEEANSYVMNYRVSTWQRRRWHAEGLLGTEAASGQQSNKKLKLWNLSSLWALKKQAALNPTATRKLILPITWGSLKVGLPALQSVMRMQSWRIDTIAALSTPDNSSVRLCSDSWSEELYQ